MTEDDIDDCSHDRIPHGVARNAAATRSAQSMSGGVAPGACGAGSRAERGPHGEATAATVIAAVETQRIAEVRRQVKAEGDINARTSATTAPA